MPQLWFNSDHTGTSHTNTARDWISVTVNRPVARQCSTGQRPFVVKSVAFKTCAAPMKSQKMYGRISNPDGSVYDDSYKGQTISWQKAADNIYVFQGLKFHLSDDGGSKLRAWLVSGGPFYFSKTSSGSTQTIGSKDFSGAPAGYIEYAEVALPPTGLTVKRNTEDLNRVDFVWDAWDVKKDFDAVGGTYAVSGYCVQVAKDAAFTDKARILYVSKGAGSVYGLYQGYDWYFRIATRNEVSEHYDLPGGIWSSSVKLLASTDGPATPSDTAGLPSGATDTGANTDTGDSGDVSDNNPDSTSNQGGDSDTSTEPVTEEIEEEVTSGDIKAAKDALSTIMTQLQSAAETAHEGPTQQSWQVVANTIISTRVYAAKLADVSYVVVKSRWAAMVTQIDQAKSSVDTAVTAATGAQSTAQRIDAAKKAAFAAQARVYDKVVIAKDKKTQSTWRAVGEALDSLAVELSKGIPVAGNAASAWTSARSAAQDASTKVKAAVVKLKEDLIEKARLAALSAREKTRAAIDLTTSPDTDYTEADNRVTDLVDDLTSLLDDTEISQIVTRTVTKPAGTTTPSTSTGGGKTTTPSSTPTTTTTNAGAPTETKTIVYTPIPDTTATRSPFGGLLISRSPRSVPGHTVYLMDRGGRQRIGEFKSPTQIEYNRIRDDQSLASITLDGDSIDTNRAVLDALATSRHEICIYRGSERVWEGPVTLTTYERQRVTVRAHDITHYLNRTVMKNAYSNAYPKLDFVVARIAGIITKELAVKESLTPPVNILEYMHTYVEKGDARTTRTTLAAESTVWQHLDDLAAKAGIDYTVIGRSLHIWDTSRPALGRLRTVTEQDFLGDTYIADYGMETATQTFVTDGQGNYGSAGGVDDFYGEIDLLATAYDENGNAVNQEDTDPDNDTVPIEEMTEQAERNLKGRNPSPVSLKVPDNSAFRMDRGLGLDVLIPGVYVPVSATLAGRTINQMMKLKEVRVIQNNTGETASITLTPASESDEAATLEDS